MAISGTSLTRRKLLEGAGAAALGLAAANGVLTQAGEAAPASAMRVARVLQPTAIDSLDPTTNTYAGGFLFSLIHGQLFKWARPSADNKGAMTVEPYMASSIEQPDATTVLVTMKHGIHFHDAHPANRRAVDASDIVATWARIKDPGARSPRRVQQEPVHIPEAIDSRTVKFTFDYPYAPFFSYLADVWQSIRPAEVIALGGSALVVNAVGCGPYRIPDRDTEATVLDAHPLPWWRPWDSREAAPFFAGIAITAVHDDPGKQEIALLGGQLDLAPVTRAGWETVMADDRFAWRRFASQDFNNVRIQHRLRPMDDIRVRQALSVGFNRGKIARTTFAGGGARPTGPIPTSRTPWAQKYRDLPFHRYRPRMARQLLAAAGFPDGLELINLYPQLDNEQTDQVKAITAQLFEVGVYLKQDSNEYATYLEKARLGKTDPEGAGWHLNIHWGNRYNDIDGYLQEYRTDGDRNYGHWGDEETDGEIDRAQRLLDPKDRREAVQSINRHIADRAWTPGTLLPISMEAWTADLEHMAVGPEWFQGTRSFIDASFRAGRGAPSEGG